MPKEYKSINEVAKDALAIQDASNLSAVLHAWAAMQRCVRENAMEGLGDSYERHPVNVLMLSKITSLMRVNADCLGGVSLDETVNLFSDAYEWCQERSE